MRRLPVLARKLVLETPVRIPDGAGGLIDTWDALGEHWAEVVAATGRDGAGESATLSLVPWRITVRGAPFGSPSRPRPEQRFREGERVFAILAVAEADARGHFLTCHAREERLK